MSVLALQDWLSGNTTNKAAVEKSLNVYEMERPIYPNSAIVGVRMPVTLFALKLSSGPVLELRYPLLGPCCLLR